MPVPPLLAFSTPLNTTAPVEAEVGEKPVVPALNDVTPVFETVIEPPNDTGLPLTLIPVPELTVMDAFCKFAFGMFVGKSAITNALKVGTAAPPVVGPAYTKLADCELDVNVNVPVVVTGEPETLKMDGADNPTLVTVPPPPPKLVIVTAPVDDETLIPLPAVTLVTPTFVSVIEPDAFVTLIPVDGVSVFNVNPVPLPIKS